MEAITTSSSFVGVGILELLGLFSASETLGDWGTLPNNAKEDRKASVNNWEKWPTRLPNMQTVPQQHLVFYLQIIQLSHKRSWK